MNYGQTGQQQSCYSPEVELQRIMAAQGSALGIQGSRATLATVLDVMREINSRVSQIDDVLNGERVGADGPPEQPTPTPSGIIAIAQERIDDCAAVQRRVVDRLISIETALGQIG